jgi:methylmalonyl-CoA mutase
MDAQQLNADILSDLKGGCTGIWIKLDTGTMEKPKGDGASLWNLESWDKALNGVFLEAVPLHIEGSIGDALSLLAIVNERKLQPMMLGLGLDPCGYFAEHGCLPGSFKKVYGLIHKILKHTQQMNIATRCVRINTNTYHNAGAHNTTELAFMLATAAEYLRNSGLSPQEMSDQLVVSLPVGKNIPENIAKLRAARLLMTALFRACGVENHIPYIHAQSSERMLTVYDPWTNMLRTTHATFSAALAKADSIAVLPYDTRLQQHSLLGKRVARNTHNILAEECGLEISGDPVRGAHRFEEQTNLLMNEAWTLFQQIERKGGIVQKLKDGSAHTQIAKEYNKRKSWISSGRLPIVGTSHFPKEEPIPSVQSPDITAEQKRIREYILARGDGPTIGGSSVQSYMSQLSSGATRFEIDEGLFFRGTIKTSPMPKNPDSLPFEELRALPVKKIPIILVGTEIQWSARAQFAEQFLLSGGIHTMRIPLSEYLQSPSKTPLIVVCGSDADYAAQVSVINNINPTPSIILVAKRSDEDIWGLMHKDCDRITLLKCIHAEAT